MERGFPDDLSQPVHPPIPAAGAGFTYEPSGANFTRVKSLQFTLTTSSAVANRLVTVQIKHVAAHVLATIPSPAVQTASSTVTYTFAAGLYPYSVSAANAVIGPLPEVWLRLGQSLAVTVANIDTADTITKITLAVDQVGMLAANGE